MSQTDLIVTALEQAAIEWNYEAGGEPNERAATVLRSHARIAACWARTLREGLGLPPQSVPAGHILGWRPVDGEGGTR